MIRAAQQAFYAFMQRFRDYGAKELQARAEAAGYGEPDVVETEDSVELRVFAFIESSFLCEMWGLPGSIAVSDAGFLRALDKAKASGKKISLRLNSGGGDVFAGVAIASAVREAGIPVRVEGVAASIASVIAAASPRVVMSIGSTIMVHRPWTYAAGNASAMRAEADTLDKLQSAMEDIYVSKTGSKFSREQWQAALVGKDGADGSWWTGAEAVANGMADEYEDGATDETRAKALLEQRQTVAEVHNVKLPKNLAELPAQAVTQKPEEAAKAKPLGQMAPSVRLAHRPGAFSVPR